MIFSITIFSFEHATNKLEQLTKADLAEKLANTSTFHDYISKAENLQFNSVGPKYDEKLAARVTISSEKEAVEYLNTVFTDGEIVFNQLNAIRSSYFAAIQLVSEIENLSKEDLAEVLSLAFHSVRNNTSNSNLRKSYDDPSCVEAVAIGAVFCLPSLLVAWGYFMCAAGVAAGAMHCCYA